MEGALEIGVEVSRAIAGSLPERGTEGATRLAEGEIPTRV